MKESTKDSLVCFSIFGLYWLIGICFWFVVIGSFTYATVSLGFIFAIMFFGIMIASMFGDD